MGPQQAPSHLRSPMFSGITLISSKIHINFIKWRFVNYGVSAFMVLAAIAGYFINDINYGIDFTGGTLIEARCTTPPDMGDLRHKANNLGIGEVSLQEFGTNEDILIRIDRQDRDEAAQLGVIDQIKHLLGPDVEYRRIENVGPRMGQELISNCLQAVLWAMLAMLCYIWIRFEWHFGICAVISLIHDAFAVAALYTIFGLEFNATALVSILITVGYSINDTVVIYDRIRENLRKYKTTDLEILLNKSINDTLSRTVLTSSATILSLLALYFFGGDVLAGYSLPILIGIAVGTYSSICLAAPLLLTLGFKIRKEAPAEEKA